MLLRFATRHMNGRYPTSSLPRNSTRLTVRQLAINQAGNDWEPTRYMRFGDERTRAAQDLLFAIPLQNPRRIVDLGCGPGNSTQLLASRYPESDLSAIDSSPNMIAKAQKLLPQVHFSQADLHTYKPSGPAVDLFYSNAVFHWLRAPDRTRVITTLLQAQPSGGVFAIQVPDNLNEPSHKLMVETAREEQFKSALRGGTSHDNDNNNDDDDDPSAIARDTFPDPTTLYNTFKPLCSKIDIWHTHYQHRLDSHEAIADWFRSTGLRPFLDPLANHQRDAFLKSYVARLRDHYPLLDDGGVLLHFPRLFMILHRA